MSDDEINALPLRKQLRRKLRGAGYCTVKAVRADLATGTLERRLKGCRPEWLETISSAINESGRTSGARGQEGQSVKSNHIDEKKEQDSTEKAALITGRYGIVCAIIAAIGVAVATWFGRGDPGGEVATRPITVVLEYEGSRPSTEFEVNVTAAGNTGRGNGSEGVAQVWVPENAVTCDDIVVVARCYERELNGPITIGERDVVVVPVRKRSPPDLKPLSPNEYPDPDSIPPDFRPSPEELVSSKSMDPNLHTLVYSNDTAEFGRLVLISFSRHQNGVSPWRVLPADNCTDTNEHTGFSESSGWFAVFFKPEDKPAEFLTTIDVYKQAVTKLTISDRDGVYRVFGE